MYIQQIYTSCLAQASYYIESRGEAAIIDPIREPGPYLQLAAERGATIRYIFETHFHADFVSGHLDLSDKTNAVIVFGPNAKPAYPAFIARHQERFLLGNITLQVLHTPGHTIESSCVLLLDENDKAQAIFTGDTLFVGDVGRPDLLSGNKSKQELGAMLYDSIQDVIMPLADEVVVYPGHGAGSACGKNLGTERFSTIGEQKKLNYALQPMSRNEFITRVTDELPVPPPYFFKDASINIIGYSNLDKILDQSLRALSIADVQALMKENSLLLDCRNGTVFSEGFIPGSLHIGLTGEFAPWVGSLIDIDRNLVLVCEKGTEKEAVTRLARIGFENISGYLSGGFESWKEAGLPVDTIESIDAKDFSDAQQNAGMQWLDVRTNKEYRTIHLEEAIHIPLDQLQKEYQALNPDLPSLVYCKGGYRSMIAISILKSLGYHQLINVKGGIDKILACSPQLSSVE